MCFLLLSSGLRLLSGTSSLLSLCVRSSGLGSDGLSSFPLLLYLLEGSLLGDLCLAEWEWVSTFELCKLIGSFGLCYSSKVLVG